LRSRREYPAAKACGRIPAILLSGSEGEFDGKSGTTSVREGMAPDPQFIPVSGNNLNSLAEGRAALVNGWSPNASHHRSLQHRMAAESPISGARDYYRSALMTAAVS
jgi:hypothetical protein